MDFKKLISHIESIDGPIETPKAPEKAAPIRLDEDTELRVLAGVTQLTESVIAERAMSKKKEKEEKKTDEGLDMNLLKAAQGGMSSVKKDPESERNRGKPYGSRSDSSPSEKDDDDDAPKTKKKSKKESIDPEAFKSKFTKMVEAKKEDKKVKGKKAEEKMDEAAKPDFLDIDKDGNKKEPMKKAAADKGGDKKDGKKGMSAKQEKYFGKKNESVKTSKKVVSESVEQPMSFREMMKLVVESGGQQQIDPLDKELFAWAERVAKSKLGEGMKAEVYAGMVYERMGGRFEMYDVLSEDK